MNRVVAEMRCAVVGTGLIGGSAALKLAQSGIAVITWDPDTSTQNLVATSGLDIASSLDECVSNADLVILATPPDKIVNTALEIFDKSPKDVVITEVGSVKTATTRVLRPAAEQKGRQFVASHPMAGKAISGFANADADLFSGCNWIICEGEDHAVETVRTFASLLGAGQILHRDATRHDNQVAMVSHFPQLLVTAIASQLNHDEVVVLTESYPLLRDTLRLSRSPYEMWQQIATTNAESILRAISTAKKGIGNTQTTNTLETIISMSQVLNVAANSHEAVDPGTLQLAGTGFRSAISAHQLSSDFIASSAVSMGLSEVERAVADSQFLLELFERANGLLD